MKGKPVGATLAAGTAWLAHDRLHRIEPLEEVYPDAPTKVVMRGRGASIVVSDLSELLEDR
jgi:hypothetical protein